MTSKRYKPIPRAPVKLVGDYWVPNDHPLDKRPQVLAVANQGIKLYAEALRALGAPQDAHTTTAQEVER